MHGQKLVIRVLDAANAPLHIEDLQLPAKAMQIIRKASEQESGMILVGGPTGSGKTTSLYAILRDIDVNQCNVVTIEDPVEIQLEGVTQIPVNEQQGNTFSSLLRSILRQDPDVILIGEIRDAETARVGVQAGMTGHLVFSTVHARDAFGAMFRLLDLGVEPYVLASGLHLVVAQRLVRQLCRYCKVPQQPTPGNWTNSGPSGSRACKSFMLPRGAGDVSIRGTSAGGRCLKWWWLPPSCAKCFCGIRIWKIAARRSMPSRTSRWHTVVIAWSPRGLRRLKSWKIDCVNSC